MVNVESFSVDNFFRDQIIMYVEGFSVDILRDNPLFTS
ncbi:hypothetical protein RABR111495_24055 [Rahnella bruchi]